jgi:hypothetical protein
MMHTKHVVCSLLLFAGIARAQDVDKKPEPFALAASAIELSEFVDACAGYLEWNILYDTREFEGAGAGAIKLQRSIVTDRDGCEELLYSLLYRQGYAVKTVDAARNVYEVLMMQGASYVELAKILERPALKRQVITTLSLQHINARYANNALRPFFAGTGGTSMGLSIGTVGNPQSLLLQGFQDEVAQAVRVIQLADVPPRPELEPMPGNKTMKEYVKLLEARIQALEKRLAKLEQKRK